MTGSKSGSAGDPFSSDDAGDESGDVDVQNNESDTLETSASASMTEPDRESGSSSELLRPTALGPPRPSLGADGASCFCVETCRNRSHSVHKTRSVSCGPAERQRRSADGSRLRRRLPVTGGSECPTPTGSTLGHNRRCTLVVACEHRRKRGEHLITTFNRRIIKVPIHTKPRRAGAVSPPCSLRSMRIARDRRSR